MHKPKTSKPTMELGKKLKPEAQTGKDLKSLIRLMQVRAKQEEYHWMDIENCSAWPDWNDGRLSVEFFDGGPSTYMYKSFEKDMEAIMSEKPVEITPKSHSSRKLALRVMMFWYMRGATTAERTEMCPPEATTTEVKKWHKDMGYQWSNCKGRTLKRIIALVLYLISQPDFLHTDRADEGARRDFWESEITTAMLLFAFTFWRDAIDFRWIFATLPKYVGRYRGEEDVTEWEQLLARDMERQFRNRLVGWLDMVYLYAVDTMADKDTEWPVACDVRLSLDLKLWGDLCNKEGFWWFRDIREMPVGAGKFTRVYKKVVRFEDDDE